MKRCWFILEQIFWKLWPSLFFLTPHIFANGSCLVTLNWLRTTKTGVKTAPDPIFAQKAFVPLCIPDFSPFMAHPNISLDGPKNKNLRFHFFLLPPLKTLSANWELNFDATDPPHSWFEQLYPKVFRGGLKVDLVLIVGQWAYRSSQSQATQIHCRVNRLF